MLHRILEVHADVDQMCDVLELMKTERTSDGLQDPRLRLGVYDEHYMIEPLYIGASADDRYVSEKDIVAGLLHLVSYSLAVFYFRRTVDIQRIFIRNDRFRQFEKALPYFDAVEQHHRVFVQVFDILQDRRIQVHIVFSIIFKFGIVCLIEHDVALAVFVRFVFSGRIDIEKAVFVFFNVFVEDV